MCAGRGKAILPPDMPVAPPISVSPPRWAALRVLMIAVVLFGLAWPVTKDALGDATPLSFALGRVVLAGLGSALVLGVLRRLRLPARRDWPVVIGIGVLQLGGFFALSHIALLFVSAGRTAVLSNVTIIWVIPLSVLLLKDRIGPMRRRAVAFGLAGVAVLAGPWAVDWTSGQAVFGNVALLLSALSWAGAILITRAMPPSRPVFELMPWCFAVATAVLLPLALWREPSGGIGPGAWPHLLAVGLVLAPFGHLGGGRGGQAAAPGRDFARLSAVAGCRRRPFHPLARRAPGLGRYPGRPADHGRCDDLDTGEIERPCGSR